jgi:hypothetical protein
LFAGGLVVRQIVGAKSRAALPRELGDFLAPEAMQAQN